MNAEFFRALDMLEKEKGIPKEYMLEKVEAALLSGFKKDNGFSNVRIELNPAKQNVRVFKQLTVVDPDTEEDIPLTAEYNFDDFDERTDKLIEIDDTTPYGDVFDDDDSGAKPAIIRRKHRFNEKTEITLEDARAINKKYNLGDIVEIEIKPKNFGRISAQTAKQYRYKYISDIWAHKSIVNKQSDQQLCKKENDKGHCICKSGFFHHFHRLCLIQEINSMNFSFISEKSTVG